ncbi:Tyrosine-protein kinase Mer, partial [Geodia barretti]
MCTFSHPNVLGMEGICLDEESQSPYLILPFMSNGDLKTFLRKKRGVNNMVDLTYPDELSHDTLLGMCYQIACGMEYL